MDLAEVNKNLSNIDTGQEIYIRLVDLRIQATLAKGDFLTLQLIENVEIRTAHITVSLQRSANILGLRASYGILRLTIHTSPGLIALVMSIITIVNIIRFSAFVQGVIRILATLWRIHQIVLELWPKYRAAWENLMSDVSQISAHIGWGIDGIGHLVNAVSGGINVLGGLIGKDWNLMRFEMMQKGNELVVQMSRMLTTLKDDPGKILNQLFENRTLLVADDTAKWWQPIAATITEASDRSRTALEGTKSVFSSLMALQTDMPEAVRRNIPESIWIALGDADTLINDKILPHLATIDRNMQFMNAILNASLKRGSELADKLANPGDLLLGVDDLPDYVKKYQEGLIDDVTSREFGFWTDQEREEVQDDLDDFDRIDRLLTAPTPEPSFLAMEVKKGQTIRGITAEPHETWFPGGLNDPR